jgi:TIR domain
MGVVKGRTPAQPERRARSAVGVFISYRRQDTKHLAGRLYDRLQDHFGKERVFIDVDSIEPGLDFGEVIDKAVRSCGVMLVLIGDNWLSSVDEHGRRRIDNPDDYVRLEIEATLSQNIRVIPVLVESATMPSSQDLPDSMASLARRNAMEMSHSRFGADVGRLIEVVERVLKVTPG